MTVEFHNIMGHICRIVPAQRNVSEKSQMFLAIVPERQVVRPTTTDLKNETCGAASLLLGVLVCVMRVHYHHHD